MGAVVQATVAVLILAAQPGAGPFAPAPGPAPFGELHSAPCLSGPETREAVQTRRIVPPFRAVAEAMREGGELVAIRICRSPDPPLIYDVAVLRRDGHLVHVIIDAAVGVALPGRRQP